jgi:hypothetical protein
VESSHSYFRIYNCGNRTGKHEIRVMAAEGDVGITGDYLAVQKTKCRS